MKDADAVRHLGGMIARGLGLGIVWGAVFGALTWAVPSVVSGEVGYLILTWLAALVGAVVGGGLGLAAGLALAIAGRRAMGRARRARLITGSVTAAIPLAILFSHGPPHHMSTYLGTLAFAGVAAVIAVMLTPRVVNGKHPQRAHERTDGGSSSTQSAGGIQ